MTSTTIAKGILKAIGVLVAVVLTLYLLYLVQSVLIYLAVSLILTLIGMPIVKFLRNKCKFKNIFAVMTTLLIFVGIIFGFIMMFVPLIASQGHNLSLLNTAAIEQNIIQLIDQASSWLEGHNIDSGRLLKESNVTSKLNFKFIPNFLNIVLGTISSFGVGLASVLFITFFFLKDRKMFSNSLHTLLPQAHKGKILNSLDKMDHLLSRYFIGLIVQLSIIFVLYLIVLLIFGVQNALIIAFLCAILNIIPYIGPLIGSILAALLTMLSNLGSDFQSEILPTTIYVMIGFWIVQVIDNNLTGPLIFSNSVNSHPLEIFLVILVAGFLFGILGMVIAVPMYTILKVFAKEFFPENRFVQLLTRKI